MLNWAGRPLEFHCTAPVKPNRAQQILYGPTLEPYLYGEQIGGALVSKTQHPPLLICTDTLPVLAVRSWVDRPVVLVLPAEAPNPTESLAPPFEHTRAERMEGSLPSACSWAASNRGEVEGASDQRRFWRLDPAQPGIGRLMGFCWGRQRLAVLENLPEEYQRVQEALASLEENFDLAEPFGRIRDAIEEARRGG